MTKHSLLGLPLLLGALALSSLAACGGKGAATGDGKGDDPAATAQGDHGPGAHVPFLNAVLELHDLTRDQRAQVMTIADEYQKAMTARRVAGGALAELY